jgi:hypothetical protein
MEGRVCALPQGLGSVPWADGPDYFDLPSAVIQNAVRERRRLGVFAAAFVLAALVAVTGCSSGGTTGSGGASSSSGTASHSSSGTASHSSSTGAGGHEGGTGGGGGAGSVCKPGTTESCYTGPAGTEGVGACMAGTWTCNAQGTAYGPCTGEVLPVPETCLTPIDDDCDGKTNEDGPGCVCTPDAMQGCYDGPPGTEGVGICVGGTATCNSLGTALGPCTGEVTPQQETCLDDLDDDCDGKTNEDGPGCVCTPNAAQSCYDGPAGTEGVGICLGGTATCNGLGTVLGPCMGEVLPQPETCGDLLDEDCDGLTEEGCTCVPGTSVSCYTGPSGTAGVGVCLGGTQTCTAQQVYGPCVGEVTPQPDTCAMPAVDNDCDGHLPYCGILQWAHAWGGPNDDEGITVTLDPSGNAILGGYMHGTVDYGCGPTTTEADSDGAMLVKLTPAGSCVWSKVWGDTAYVYSAVTDAAGNVYFTGAYDNAIDFGGGPIPNAGNDDVFVAAVDANGNYMWAYGYGDDQAQDPSGIAIDPTSGDVLVSGYFAGSIDFGCGALTSAGANDIFVAKLTSSGACVWSNGYGDASNQLAEGIAVDPSGNAFVTGELVGTADFGCGPLTSQGLSDVFLVELDPKGGCLWSQRFGDAQNQIGYGVATDGAGDVYVTGAFSGTIDFGTGVLTSAGGADVFAARFGPTGTPIWAEAWGAPNDQLGFSIAVGAGGQVAVTGAFFGSCNFGTGALTSLGAANIWVGKYDASGDALWTESFGSAATESGKSVVLDAAGDVYVAGSLNAPANFGAGPIEGGGNEDMFIVKLGP